MKQKGHFGVIRPRRLITRMPDRAEKSAEDGSRAHVLLATRYTGDDVVADFSSALRHLSNKWGYI